MKRSLLSVFLIGILGMCALQANEKSGVFIGADVGYALNVSHESLDLQGNTGSSSFSTQASSTGVIFNLSYGLRVGYQQYFGNYNGLRIYGNFNYSNFGSDSMMKYGANVDYLLNFSDTDSPWGLFVGVGYEWMGGKSKDVLEREKENPVVPTQKIKTDGLLVNVGLSKIYNNHHRIEFGARVPLYTYNDIDTPNIKVFKRTLTTIYFGYSYSF